MPSAVEHTPEQRIVEALPFLTNGTAVTGWAALRWLGATWLDGSTAGGTDQLPVPMLVASHHKPQTGYLFSEERWTYATAFEHDGLVLTDPWHATCFAMRMASSVWAAVSVLDMTCHANLVSLAEMEQFLALHNGFTGIPQARAAFALANENAWSPQEVRLRKAWEQDLGFPPPLCNQPIFDLRGNHLLTPDILDPIAGVFGEYDGEHHLTRAQRTRDRDREELARDHGLEYFVVMAGELGTSQAERRMRAARNRARFQPEDERSWTIEPPAWWAPADTVAQRRELALANQNLWLKSG